MSNNRIIINLIFILVFSIYWKSVAARRLRRVTPADQEELDKAQRNAECCAKKMRCCVRVQAPPIEIRAVIARCPNLGGADSGHVSRTMTKPVMASNEFNIKSFQGFDEDEPLIQSRVTECRSKIIMTMKLHHQGAIVCKSQYIVVDHVYDPLTDRSVRLLNPYVIRLRQEPVSKSFHLKFIDYVNSEAREEVHNKQESNFTGCYTNSRRSTCGQVKFDGKVIPFSEGFCCSCDTKMNLQLQPESHSSKNEEIISYSDPAYLLDRVGCPRNFYNELDVDQVVSGTDVLMNLTTKAPVSDTCSNITKNQQNPVSKAPGSNVDQKKRAGNAGRWKYTTYSNVKATNLAGQTTTYHPFYLKRDIVEEKPQPQAYLKKISTFATKQYNQQQYMNEVKKSHNSPQSNYLNPIDDTRDKFQQRLARKMRQTFPSGIQKRGGQNCADRYTPPGLDPDHYHESAHCLRFSDVWYGIYKLGEPNIEQIVYINIYERFETQARSDKWREVTNGTVRLGNRFTHYEDDLPTISMTFNSKTLTDPAQYDNWESKRILIPEGVRSCEIHKYPEMRGGPDEYLVVPASRIALEGEMCDTIGVGFEAFFKQPQRCGLPRGTCLHNQPKHLWRNDKHLETKNKMGCYFLKYHANITSQPLFVNETTGEKYLFVEYTGAHVTIIDIEIKADQNAVIRDTANAAITEVYVDSTCGKYTMLTIKVINTGLVSTKFMVQLSDFPLELPEYFSKIRSKLVLIAPQYLHIFNLEIKATLPSDLMYCSVEVMNKKNELVALRRVRIQKFDRCICAWYCLCACVASLTGLRCNPMSLEHYHAAGFEGAFPIVTYMVHFTMLDDLLSIAFYFILFLLGILLLLGLFKALLGLCCLGIGVWGLPVVLDLPKPMKRYYERNLRKERVIYDEEGWPVHPTTFIRTRNISVATTFCSNLVFFYTYPFACTIIIFKKLCCPYSTQNPCPGVPSKQRESRIFCRCSKKKKTKRPCGDPNCVQRICADNQDDPLVKLYRESLNPHQKTSDEDSSGSTEMPCRGVPINQRDHIVCKCNKNKKTKRPCGDPNCVQRLCADNPDDPLVKMYRESIPDEYSIQNPCPGVPHKHRESNVFCKCHQGKTTRPCGDPNCIQRICADNKDDPLVKKYRESMNPRKIETETVLTVRSGHRSDQSSKDSHGHRRSKHKKRPTFVAEYQFGKYKTPFKSNAKDPSEKIPILSPLPTYNSTNAQPSSSIQPSGFTSVNLSKKPTEEVPPVTTSESDYDETNARSPMKSPRTTVRTKFRSSGRRSTRSIIPSFLDRRSKVLPSSSTSVTSHDQESNATYSTHSGTYETSAVSRGSIVEENVAVQTGDNDSPQKSSYKTGRPNSM